MKFCVIKKKTTGQFLAYTMEESAPDPTFGGTSMDEVLSWEYFTKQLVGSGDYKIKIFTNPDRIKEYVQLPRFDEGHKWSIGRREKWDDDDHEIVMLDMLE